MASKTDTARTKLREEAGTQFIDISDKTAKAKVVREGHEVPQVGLDPKKTDFLVDNLITVTHQQLPRVISQSISAGTRVTPGTVVNLVLAPKEAIPFSIFDELHADLKAAAISHVDDLVENKNVREVLLNNETASEVKADEKALLIAEFKKKGITVNEADPERTFAKAFDNIRGAVAFR
ncbi:MAG TPA: PASTA domain-containing protein [Pyrinomonadaceae bacterium]